MKSGALTTYLPLLLFIAAILLVPSFVDDAFLLNKYSRYLVLGMLAVALSFSWGYAGILNLGQAVSFGLGAYCMAMHLKLSGTSIHTGADGLPDFMVWNNLEVLPWFWVPFDSLAFAVAAGILVPVVAAALLAWFMFRGRITGVYVAIITLATLVVTNLLIIDQQPYTGGFNGITDLALLEAGGIVFDAYSANVYYLAAGALSLALIVGYAAARSQTGLILQAVRDSEQRVRFFGYDVAAYQIFAMALSAAIAGVAGMLYTVIMEFASPTFMDIPLSLAIVIWVAVGGRQSLLGAAIGAIFVTGVQGALSESAFFLKSWSLLMGLMFIAVVLFLPMGLAGAAGSVAGWLRRRLGRTAEARALETRRGGA